METLYVNPSCFFLLKDEDLLLWNYEDHTQFILEKSYFDRLYEIENGNTTPINDAIEKDLIENNIISYQKYPQKLWGFDDLSKIFHIGSQNVPEEYPKDDLDQWIDDYILHCKNMFKEDQKLFYERVGRKYDLSAPDSDLIETPLFSVLKKRKTSREFFKKPVCEKTLSHLLYATFGLIHGSADEPDEIGIMNRGIRKSSPSGGAMHPTEAYVVCLRIENGISPGVYHYNVKNHQLNLLKEGFYEKELIALLSHQYFLEGISFGIFLTSRLERIWLKYKHSRGYRAAYLDVGHLSQTFLMMATSMNLQTWITGSFRDKEVAEFLKVDPVLEPPLLFLACGKGSNNALDQRFISRIKKMRQKESILG